MLSCISNSDFAGLLLASECDEFVMLQETANLRRCVNCEIKSSVGLQINVLSAACRAVFDNVDASNNHVTRIVCENGLLPTS